MGTRRKILISIFLIIIVVLAVWQFQSPRLIPSAGTKYLSSIQYANRGSWVLLESSSHGRVFLAFSIANLTYPHTGVQTSYSVLISKVNESAPSSYTRGFTLKITALLVQDSYDGSVSLWAASADLPDAVQAITIFNFKTSASHQLRFTVSYQLYKILVLGSLLDHSTTQSFNVTQNVV